MNVQQTATQPPLSQWLEAPELGHLTEAFGSHLEQLHRDALMRLIRVVGK